MFEQNLRMRHHWPLRVQKYINVLVASTCIVLLVNNNPVFVLKKYLWFALIFVKLKSIKDQRNEICEKFVTILLFSDKNQNI